MRLHGVEGVADQVDQNLFEAGLVDVQLHINELPVQLQCRIFQARTEQLQRRVHGFAEAGLALIVTTPGKRSQAGGDPAHAVDQVVDGFQIGAGDIELAALEKTHGIA